MYIHSYYIHKVVLEQMFDTISNVNYLFSHNTIRNHQYDTQYNTV